MITYRRFPWVHEFKDRHGKLRRYFRRPGFKRVALVGEPGTVEFAESYQHALDGTTAPKLEIGAARTVPGTVAAAVAGYFASSAFASMAPETRRTWRNNLERFRNDHGNKRIALLRPEHIDRIMAGKADKPASARNFMKALRSLMRWSITARLRGDDPTAAFKLPKVKSSGYRTWTETDIAAFEARHPVGTRARLALALLLYSAQRRADIVRMGRQHLRDGALHVAQQKTGAKLTIPLHPELAAVLAATTTGNLTFLTTKAGKPFTAAGFTNWFRDMCNEAGLPNGTSAHGLRKAACRRLAEAGCSANEIAAISGHTSLSEVSRYTKEADQARMAKSAMNTVYGAFQPKKKGTQVGKPSRKGLPK